MTRERLFPGPDQPYNAVAQIAGHAAIYPDRVQLTVGG
jgi:uncharacterized protein (DUF427 family)